MRPFPMLGEVVIERSRVVSAIDLVIYPRIFKKVYYKTMLYYL